MAKNGKEQNLRQRNTKKDVEPKVTKCEKTKAVEEEEEDDGFSYLRSCLFAFFFVFVCLCITTIIAVVYVAPSISFSGAFNMNTGGKRSNTGQRTKDQTVTLEVPLEDIYFGNSVQVSL